MKNVVLVLIGFVLAMACGTAASQALGEPVNITDRLVWVTQTFECERDLVFLNDDPSVVGFDWPEMAPERVRAMHVVHLKQDGERQIQFQSWKFRAGFLETGMGVCEGYSYIVTLVMEMPDAN